jgi:hypothetical protein
VATITEVNKLPETEALLEEQRVTAKAIILTSLGDPFYFFWG